MYYYCYYYYSAVTNLKELQQTFWVSLPQNLIYKAVKNLQSR